MARLIVGNWKMNLNPTEAVALVKQLEAKMVASDRVEVVICPPFIDLFPISEVLDMSKLKLGAQNIHYLDHGPFTGEISPAMLKGMVTYAIIGHSERRAMGEDDKLIAKKVSAAFRNKIVPVLCVGENLNEREHGLSRKVVVDQLTAGLSMITTAEVKDLVVAYEPVWAIGSGTPATPDQIRPIITAIRQTLEELYGEAGGVGARVIYGASVAPEFVHDILSIDGVDGLLPGGASLIYEEFAAIIKAADREIEA